MSDERARAAYAAYGAVTGHRNYQGLPMPAFDDLGDTIREAWRAAAAAVADPLMEVWVLPLGATKTVLRDLAAIKAALRLTEHNEETIMGALDNLKAADQALKDEVTAFLADVAGRLGNPDADVQAVADDINAEVAALRASDPANASTPEPPGDGPAPTDAGDGTADAPAADDAGAEAPATS